MKWLWLLLLLVVFTSSIYAADSSSIWQPLTKGYADTLYCQQNGTCVLQNLTTVKINITDYTPLDDRYLNKTGGTMTGDIIMDGNSIQMLNGDITGASSISTLNLNADVYHDALASQWGEVLSGADFRINNKLWVTGDIELDSGGYLLTDNIADSSNGGWINSYADLDGTASYSVTGWLYDIDSTGNTIIDRENRVLHDSQGNAFMDFWIFGSPAYIYADVDMGANDFEVNDITYGGVIYGSEYSSPANFGDESYMSFTEVPLSGTYDINIVGGDNGAEGEGGSIYITGGDATSPDPGIDGGKITIQTGQDSDTIYEHLSLQSNGGNVGIGTDEPSHKLDVQGDTNINGDIFVNGSYFYNKSGANENAFRLYRGDQNYGFRLDLSGSPKFIWRRSGQDAFGFTSSGVNDFTIEHTYNSGKDMIKLQRSAGVYHNRLYGDNWYIEEGDFHVLDGQLYVTSDNRNISHFSSDIATGMTSITVENTNANSNADAGITFNDNVGAKWSIGNEGSGNQLVISRGTADLSAPTMTLNSGGTLANLYTNDIITYGDLGFGNQRITSPARPIHGRGTNMWGRFDRIGGNGAAFLLTRENPVNTVQASWLFGLPNIDGKLDDSFCITDFNGAVAGTTGVTTMCINETTNNMQLYFDLDVQGNITGNQIYGFIYVHNESNDDTVISASNTYVNISEDVKAGDLNGFTFTDYYLEAQVAGRYTAVTSLSFSQAGGAGDEWHLALGINGVEQEFCHSGRKIGTITDVGSTTNNCIISLSVGDRVTAMIENENDNDNANVQDLQLTLTRIGD